MHDDPMIDPLDREIAQALAVDPSPAFVARVRQRIDAEPEPHEWRFSWLLATAGALAAAATIAIVVMPRNVQQGPNVLVARASVAVTDLPDVASGFSRTEPRPAGGPERAALHSETVRRSEPEILIDAREASALRALIAGARTGAIDLEPVLRASKPSVMELAPVTAIDIPLITFEPIGQGVPQ